MKAKCLISKTNDPFLNLAIEDWIFNDMETGEQILFLWQNSPSVIIGRNQNPWAECNVAELEKDEVNLVRRHSGGGTVFQDFGNMNFTFLSSRAEYDRKRNFEIIVRALKRFGVNAEVSGRNDILVDGKKISGSAFKEKVDRAFHHGTLMINVDLSRLERYLTPSKKKLLAKGTTSVRARVANLKEFNSEIYFEKLCEAIIEEFFVFYDCEKKVDFLDHNSLAEIVELKNYFEMLKSRDWRFGETPRFNHFLEERFSWGGVDVHLDAKNGKIENAKIFSDALDVEMIHDLENCLKGILYDKDSVALKLSELALEKSLYRDKIEEFRNWIVGQI